MDLYCDDSSRCRKPKLSHLFGHIIFREFSSENAKADVSFVDRRSELLCRHSRNLIQNKQKQQNDFSVKMSEGPSKIQFKSVKRKRPIRKANSESEEDDSEVNQDALEETIELQKLRKRSHGVNAATLASGKKVSKVDEMVNNDPDPFKLKTGGLLTLDKAKQAVKEQEAEETEIGTQFSKETRVRDEDEEMRKFIEVEMEKRRGKNTNEDDANKIKYLSPEEQALLSLPEHLRKSHGKKNEEMLSSQMLSGIPEVDLGIEEKIRNIEATESAKKKLAEERSKKKQAPSEFVPTNLAVNFQQPNRFKTDALEPENDHKKPEKTIITQNTVVVGDTPVERVIEEGARDNDPTKATDDLHLTKFKKQFQRK